MTAFAQTYHRKPLALTAMPFGVSGAVWANALDKLSVALVERVPALAMRLCGIIGLDRIPTQRVRSHADKLQMRWIHATAIPAQMVSDLCGIEDRAVGLFVGKAVCAQSLSAGGVFAAPNVEGSVAVTIKGQEPRPAAVAICHTNMQSESCSVGHSLDGHTLQDTTHVRGMSS